MGLCEATSGLDNVVSMIHDFTAVGWKIHKVIKHLHVKKKKTNDP
jgi:hypothetical protein